MPNKFLRGAAGGLDALVQVLEQAEERKRRAKYEDIQNTLFEQSQADRNTRLAREAEDYEFKLDERYGEDDVAGAVESLSPFLKHSTMGQGPFSGPTARGPGGEVGVPRGPEVDEDPIVSAISAASRPHLKRASDGRLRNPATSAAARARTEQLGDFQMERTARREDAEHAASLRPPPAVPRPTGPVRGTPEYLKAMEDEEAVRARFRPPQREPVSLNLDDDARKYVAARVRELMNGNYDEGIEPLPGPEALKQARQEADEAFGTKLSPAEKPTGTVSAGPITLAPKAGAKPAAAVTPPAAKPDIPHRLPSMNDADRWEELRRLGMSPEEATAQVNRERGG